MSFTWLLWRSSISPMVLSFVNVRLTVSIVRLRVAYICVCHRQLECGPILAIAFVSPTEGQQKTRHPLGGTPLAGGEHEIPRSGQFARDALVQFEPISRRAWPAAGLTARARLMKLATRSFMVARSGLAARISDRSR